MNDGRQPERHEEYLQHILESAAKVARYTAALDKSAFLGDEKTQDAVIRNLEIIGEASRNIERHHQNFATSHPDVPWEDVYLMRNRVSHGYVRQGGTRNVLRHTDGRQIYVASPGTDIGLAASPIISASPSQRSREWVSSEWK